MSDTSASHASKPHASLRDVGRLLGGYWRSDDWKIGWLLLLVIPAIYGLMVYLGLLLNRLNGSMFDALDARQANVFWHVLLMKAGVMAIWVASFAIVERLVQVLQMRWRTWMNARFLGRWLERKAYYRLDRSGVIDNPDQRLSEDMLKLTVKGLEFGFEFLHQSGRAIVFTGVLWGLSRDIVFDVGGMHIAIPGLVVFLFIGFCLVSSGLVEWLGRPLLRARYRQHACEGDYRFGLVRVRENVEPIALYAGERAEQRKLDGAFNAIRRNWRDVVRYTFGVNFSMQGSNQAVQVVPWMLAAGAYFAGSLTMGGLMRFTQACNDTRIALLWFIQNYSELADVRAALARLCELDRLLDAAESPHDIRVTESQDAVLRIADMVLESPDGRALSQPASLDIPPGSRCVIVGPSGCGKSTFLLSLAGLWWHGRGHVEMPGGQRSMFIPQRPYVPIGTLKDALCYPGQSDDFDDAVCAEVLRACRMGHYADKLGEAAHWSKRLSPGEQQRLAFGRVLLQKPDIVFLDESTSALDADNEREMYALIHERLPVCTVISVAHRESVREMHQRTLDFTPA
ncbi:MAG: ABC transporter ATP-binding protein/permease [Pseudoxanthomonas sp.]